MRELIGAGFFSVALIVFGCGGGTAGSQPTDEGTGASSSLGGGGPAGGNQGTVINLGGGGSGAEGGGGGVGASASICGNGLLETDEGCDDANTLPGDGCSGACRVEFGWVCPTAGQPCQQSLVCGDGQPGVDEACDDGNTTAGDGCTSCQVDPGFACTGWGPGSCTPTTLPPVCPNSKVEAGETCDDGNATASDGCSATCQLEAGWTCPQPGAAWEKNEYCGDGVLNGTEGCDDGNLRAGDC
jgi:cysteine-rich repeat protein